MAPREQVPRRGDAGPLRPPATPSSDLDYRFLKPNREIIKLDNCLYVSVSLSVSCNSPLYVGKIGNYEYAQDRQQMDTTRSVWTVKFQVWNYENLAGPWKPVRALDICKNLRGGSEASFKFRWVSHFVESSFKSIFELLEFLLDEIFGDTICRLICSTLLAGRPNLTLTLILTLIRVISSSRKSSNSKLDWKLDSMIS